MSRDEPRDRGAYVARWEVEVIEGLEVGSWAAEWDDNALPGCDRCRDLGEWVGEDSEIETCPDCEGKGWDRAIAKAWVAR